MANQAVRTIATFQSASFNITEPKEYFINPCCFGDDLAAWLVARLREAGVEVDAELGQEDFGWYFTFEVAEASHCVVLAYDDNGRWVAEVERDVGLLRSLFGGRRKRIAASAVRALHGALAAPEIENLQWHERQSFNAGRDDLGTPTP
jgi:hypothetical protein